MTPELIVGSTLFLHWGLVNGIEPDLPKCKEEEKGWSQVRRNASVYSDP